MRRKDMNEEILKFLDDQFDFGNLPSSELDELSKVIRQKIVRRGQWLFEESEEWDYVYLVKSGYLQMFNLKSDGDCSYLSFVTPNDMFPMAGVLSGSQYPCNAVAICQSEVYLIPVKRLRKILIHHYAFGMSFMHRMDSQLINEKNAVERKTGSSASSRVIDIINGLAQDYGEFYKDRIEIPFRVCVKDLAVLSCSSRDTVSAVMHQLFNQKKLLYNKKRIIILDNLKEE